MSKRTSLSQRPSLALHVLFPLTSPGLGFSLPEADIGSFCSPAKEPGCYVYVMLTRRGLHPSSDAGSTFQGLDFGTAKAARGAGAARARPLSEGLVRCSLPQR